MHHPRVSTIPISHRWDEAVGCEPLGYIGYYSGKIVYDWPGLNSRKVVAWEKANPNRRCLENMLRDLQPEYLFLRDVEMTVDFYDPAWFKQRYHVMKTFIIDAEAAKHMRWLDTNPDTHFRVYKKIHPGDPPRDDALWPTEPPDLHKLASY